MNRRFTGPTGGIDEAEWMGRGGEQVHHDPDDLGPAPLTDPYRTLCGTLGGGAMVATTAAVTCPACRALHV